MLLPDDLITSNKVDALAEQLRRIAFERGPDSKMPTAREIRDALGVGMSTVNSALAALEEQNIIYRKHGVGIFVSPDLHRKSIAVLIDGTYFTAPGTSPFWSLLWGALIAEAEQRNSIRRESFVFSLSALESDPAAPLPDIILRAVQAGQIHGVLGIGLELKTTRYLAQQKIPCVNFAGPGKYRVILDGASLVAEGVKALAARGCRRIGLWRPVTAFRPTSPEFIVHPEEIGAFSETLKACGLPLYPHLMRQTLHLLRENVPGTVEPLNPLTHQEQGFLLATEVFTDPNVEEARPDGIVSTDDMLTWGIVTALGRLGLRPGQEIKIATHCNRGSNVLFGYEQELYRIEVNPQEIVEAVFSLLDRLIREPEVPGEIVVTCSGKPVMSSRG